MTRLTRVLLLATAVGAAAIAAAFTNTASSAVQNMKPLVVDDYNGPALRPLQIALCLENNATVCTVPDAAAVPDATSSGEWVTRYVIEYVSVTCSLSSTTDFVRSIGLTTSVDGAFVTHHFVPVPVPGEGVVVAQATRLYADPGSEIDLVVGASAVWTVCHMSVSGHLAVE